jgi:hypothetical protein
MKMMTIAVLFLFFNGVLSSQENQIMLTLHTTKGVETKYVNSDTKELYFGKTYIESIEGLDRLPMLERVVFDMTGFLEDFSFLKDARQIKRIALVLVRPKSWDFIESLVNIEEIYIRSSRVKNIRLDLSRNTKLKYLEISGGILDVFPELINVPPSLEYLNLSFNNIQSVPAENREYDGLITLLYANKVEYFESKNILFGNPRDILPSEYIITDVSYLENRYEYDAFGKPYKGDFGNGIGLGYTGKPHDAATGLYITATATTRRRRRGSRR